MQTMQYKDFCFSYNPARLQVIHQRRTAQHHCPGYGSITQVLGEAPRIVRGSGSFWGEQAMAEFEALHQVYCQGGAGMLLIPMYQPILAYFTALEITGQGGSVEFSFEFIQETSSPQIGTCGSDLIFLKGNWGGGGQ